MLCLSKGNVDIYTDRLELPEDNPKLNEDCEGLSSVLESAE
jgi:hypothetical protein